MTEQYKIPATPMSIRYRKLKGQNTAEHTEQAEADSMDVSAIARDFAESADLFASFPASPDEPFYPGRGHDLLDAARERGTLTTAVIQARMIDEGVAVDSGPQVHYIDREIVPCRTKPELAYEDRDGTYISFDVLLERESVPIVCELKAGSDRNVYYALMQGLASCAQIVSPEQRARLSRAARIAQETLNEQREPYGRPTTPVRELNESGPIEFWVLLASHDAAGEAKPNLERKARNLAAELVQNPDFNRFVSAIRFVELEMPEEGPIELKISG